MYSVHPAFTVPEPSAKLWRYFDLGRFLSFIDRREMYFASLTLMKDYDPWEGYWPDYDFRQLFPHAEDAEKALRLSEQMARVTFVNSWHVNEHESEAMWRSYGEHLAVQTTFQQLTEGFPKNEIYAGLVRYIDPDTETLHHPDQVSVYALAMTKRHSFEHERELRVLLPEYVQEPAYRKLAVETASSPDVAQDARTNDFEYSGKGVYVPIDIEKLISVVYVSPRLPEWYVGLLERLLMKYDLGHIPVKQSQLSRKPEL